MMWAMWSTEERGREEGGEREEQRKGMPKEGEEDKEMQKTERGGRRAGGGLVRAEGGKEEFSK